MNNNEILSLDMPQRDGRKMWLPSEGCMRLSSLSYRNLKIEIFLKLMSNCDSGEGEGKQKQKQTPKTQIPNDSSYFLFQA